MKKVDKNNKDERPVYILCPRCEINYIDKREKLCPVCKAEMGIGDSSFLLPDEEDETENRICPVCHVNLLGEDEEVCFECLKEREEKEKESKEVDADDDDSGSWDPFADDEEEEVPDGMQEILEEDEEDEEDEDEMEETVSDEPDDFDFNVDPNDYEEDEEFEEDED